jgi:hypothetical protein
MELTVMEKHITEESLNQTEVDKEEDVHLVEMVVKVLQELVDLIHYILPE